MTTVPESFGSLVFDSRVMKARLSADVYHSLKPVSYTHLTLPTILRV